MLIEKKQLYRIYLFIYLFVSRESSSKIEKRSTKENKNTIRIKQSGVKQNYKCNNDGSINV